MCGGKHEPLEVYLLATTATACLCDDFDDDDDDDNDDDDDDDAGPGGLSMMAKLEAPCR